MVKDVENPMVNDRLWDEIDKIEQESEWERFCRMADDEYDENSGESFFAWSRRQDGYVL